VLASLALMAAPSWAAKGGNSANAALCEPGGYPGVLFNQQGEAFTNEGACTKYAAKGGQIAGVDVVAEPAAGGSFKETCSGFGLDPSKMTICGALYDGFSSDNIREHNAANGTASISRTLSCAVTNHAREESVKVTELQVAVETAQDKLVVGHFPVTGSGC
jgi:hypothetical protein